MVFPGFALRYRFPSPFVPAPWPVVLPHSVSARFSGPSLLVVRLMIEGLKEVQLKNMLKRHTLHMNKAITMILGQMLL